MKSVHDLVPSQPLQARAVGLPVRSAGSGNTSIKVEVYALGVGVALAGQGRNLSNTEGSLELEANGKRVVFDPLASRKTEGFVAPVQSDVAAISLSLQAVDKHELAQFRSGFSRCHCGAPSRAKAAILSLPQGWGKTTIAPALAAFLGLDRIVEEWRPALGLMPGALHLTNDAMEGGAT